MNKSIFILEEDSDDWSLVRETLLELGMNVPLQFFSNSTDLFAHLDEAPLPSLVLVDYNTLPDNGLQVLKRLKSSSRLCEIPVVILSDSDLAQYRNECYQCGAASFIKKPDTAEGTRKKIGTFFSYWLDVVEL